MSKYKNISTELPPAGVDLLITAEDGTKFVSRLMLIQYDKNGQLLKCLSFYLDNTPIYDWMVAP